MCSVIICNLFLEINIFKHTSPSMENMQKREVRLMMLHKFKLRRNASETSVNINKAWERDPQVIGLYERGSKHFVVEMGALNMKKVDDGLAALTANS